jgi:hypothetical protein
MTAPWSVEGDLDVPCVTRYGNGGMSGAVFSTDEAHRYVLWRTWEPRLPTMVVIGLNPSTATEVEDDPTIRRCIQFAKREGCGRYIMLNLFAFRATQPEVMRAAADPVGPYNDRVLRTIASRNLGPVVAAWGVHGAFQGRGETVTKMLPGLLAFGTTKDGHPKHPLYLKASTPLVFFP